MSTSIENIRFIKKGNSLDNILQYTPENIILIKYIVCFSFLRYIFLVLGIQDMFNGFQ